MMNMKRYKNTRNPNVLSALKKLMLVFCMLLSVTGCRQNKRHENLQDENDVAGFIFHFDQRSETVRLVSFRNKNKLPVKVKWYYPDAETLARNRSAKAASEAAAISGTQDNDMEEAVTEGMAAVEAVTEASGAAESVTEANMAAESVTEAAVTAEAVTEAATAVTDPSAEDLTEQKDREAPEDPEGTCFTEDEDTIVEILNAFNNIIVVGSGNNSITDVNYFITFVLPDGSECRFDFISENTVRISDHNYTIESDGNLWKILRQ